MINHTLKCEKGFRIAEVAAVAPPVCNLVRRTMNSMTPNSKVFDNRLNLNSKRVVEEMILLLKIALFCTSKIPLDRPSM